MTKLHVITDCGDEVIFVAEVLPFHVAQHLQGKVFPRPVSIERVAEGTGNKGNKLQFLEKFDGHAVRWKHFQAYAADINGVK